MPYERKQQTEIEQVKKTAASMPPEQRKALEEAMKMLENMQSRKCASFRRTNDPGSHR
jgi:hypothetical protein